MRMRCWGVAGCIWLLAGCPGCMQPVRGGGRTPLAASPTPYDVDIPLPAGFRLVDKSSEDWSAGRIRYIRHQYVGTADKPAVRGFYRRQMPLVRWTATSDSNVHGRYTMRFERMEETCTITIEDGKTRRWGEVIVEVMIAPSR